MEYFVTGGTGFIGSHVVRNLVADGHDVRVLTRDASATTDLPAEAVAVEGDLTDRGSMREPMAGVDGVFHLAAWYDTGPGPWNEEFAERVNVEGTRNVLELMAELDVPKGVYASSIVVNSDTDGEVVDESYRHDGSFTTVYERTKWKAHYEVALPMMADGLPLVVVMPGAVYGPGARGPMREKLWVPFLEGDLPVVADDAGYALTHVEDVATAFVRAMAQGEPGEEYIVAGHNRSLVDVLDLAEEITGVPAPRAVPSSVFGVLARLVSLVEPTIRPPEGFESESLGSLTTTYYADDTKARRELGIDHRPLEAGLRKYFEWEMDRQESRG